MSEKNIDKLMKESLPRTSDDFTDKLMSKIEKEEAPARIPYWLKAGFVFAVILLLLIPLLLQLLVLNTNIFTILMNIPLLFLVFFALNRFLILNGKLMKQINIG